MRVTCRVLCQWKEAATVMLVARNRATGLQSKGITAQSSSKGDGDQWCEHFDYKVLMLERSTKSKFMPSAFVYPGGVVGDADSSEEWKKLYSRMGISDLNLALPQMLQDIRDRAPMFCKSTGSVVSADVTYRISAIRECFEEAGIMLFKTAEDLKEPKKVMSSLTSNIPFDQDEINKWRSIVMKDESKFVDFCSTFDIVPDIWSLLEWNCWLTPTHMPALHSNRRYDTAFYICCLDETPDSVHDEKEIVSSRWREPAEMIIRYKNQETWIAPPQIYELSRLCKFQNYEELAKFANKRATMGSERWLPIRTNCDDAILAVLPGDDLYPTVVDELGEQPPPTVSGSAQDNLHSTTNHHRFEIRDMYDVKLQANVPQLYSHCDPMPQEEIFDRFPMS